MPEGPAYQAVMRKDGLSDRLRKSVRILGEIEPRSELQIAIIESLLEGPRTIAELSREILGEGPEVYQAQYMKVQRAIRLLESRGYVSTRLFGKPKPYRLTPYAWERVGHLASGRAPRGGLILVGDLVLYGLTILVGSLTAFAPYDEAWVPLAFLYLAGISTARVYRTLRQVS
jgi:DNA-binding PadR family transcriptional regulator